MKPIKLFEMFAGYGGASFALKKAGIPFECVGYSEFDPTCNKKDEETGIRCDGRNKMISSTTSKCEKCGKTKTQWTIQCYNQNHPNIKNYGDCQEIEPNDLPDFDLLTGGFPCQDVSVAGNRDLSKGRTLLVNDIFRIAKVKQPKYMLLENVKGLLSTPLWKDIRYTLRKLGYDLAYKVLNSKDYGIPQNRVRIWIVCKKGKFAFGEFQFPEKEKLKIKLWDLLEEEVDKKYYISENQIKLIFSRSKNYQCKFNPETTNTLRTNYDSGYSNETYIIDIKGNKKSNKDVASCLTNKGYHSDMDLICDFRNDEGLRIRKDGNSPTLGTMERGGLCRTPIIIHNVLPIVKQLSNHQGNKITQFNEDYHPCIVSQGGNILRGVGIQEKNRNIRRLTPTECFRLMGFLNDEINLDSLSDTQKYKLVGNGWEIQTVSKIFFNLFKK